MSDLISRADAIERIVNDNVVGGMDRINEYRNSNEHNDYLNGISCAIATVDDVPPAETHEIRTETHGVCLISKDDAMGAVQDHFNADGFKGYDDGQKMMDRIKAIPSAEAEFTDLPDIPRYYYEKVVGNMAHEINMLKEQLESADAVQGEWEIEERQCIYGKKFILTCSVCGDSVSVTEAALPHEKYCRNCGARMKGGND